jgi:hypothetical protein
LNPEGTVRWSNLISHPLSLFPVLASPCIGTNGDVYVGDRGGRLYSFTPNGRTNWVFQVLGAIETPATVAEDGTIFFTSLSQNLYAVRPNGTALWQTPVGNTLDGSVLLPDGRYVFSTTGGDLIAVRTAQKRGGADWSTFRGDYQRTGRVSNWLTPGTTNFSQTLHVGESLSLQPQWNLGTQEVIRAELLVGTNVVTWSTNLALPLTWMSSASGTNVISIRLITASGRQYSTRGLNAALQRLTLTYQRTPSNTVVLQSSILPDRLYSLESSSNLVHWIDVTNHASTGASVITWPAVTPNSSAESFRVRSTR